MPEIGKEALAQLVAVAVTPAMQQTTRAQQQQSQRTRPRQEAACLKNWHEWHKLHLAQARAFDCAEELTAAEGRDIPPGPKISY